MSNHDVCAYCGLEVLDGHEEPEHAIPAAINGRLTTKTVCGPCNTSAGKDIDQPWLSDPFVLHVRFMAQVPDRRGNLLASSPLLTGQTDDGRRVTMRLDGTPIQLNTPATIDPSTGEATISAGSQQALDEQTAKQRRKAEAQGRTFTAGEQQSACDRPEVTGRMKIIPNRWQREGAKIALALLAEQQPGAWRRSRSAELLRQEIRTARVANDVRFVDLAAVAEFAECPATAVVLARTEHGPAVSVSLMGVFAVAFLLADDLDRTDWAWVSDPIDPSRSFEGRLGEVIYARHEALGLL